MLFGFWIDASYIDWERFPNVASFIIKPFETDLKAITIASKLNSSANRKVSKLLEAETFYRTPCSGRKVTAP